MITSVNPNIPFTGIKNTIEEKRIFKPIYADTLLPADSKFKPVSIPTANGKHITCYYIPPKPNMPTIMYCHGIKHNASFYIPRFPKFVEREGYGALIVDYRGFHKEDKTQPSEKTIYEDANSALKFLEQQKITPENIILWGHSMGGGVAVELASKHKFKAVIIDSTFTSMEDMVHLNYDKSGSRLRHILGNIVANEVLVSRFDNRKKMSSINSPVLMIHSRGDRLIPPWMAQKNYEALTRINKNVKMEWDFHLPNVNAHADIKWRTPLIENFVKKITNS